MQQDLCLRPTDSVCSQWPGPMTGPGEPLDDCALGSVARFETAEAGVAGRLRTRTAPETA
jgi:hypothetical protein